MTKSSARIYVTNFDAPTQANLWLSLGSQKASETLVAMLRTAILLGGQLVVDRNQLLDGIFFLAHGPDGLREKLGLDSGSPLPLVMACSPQLPRNSGTALLVPKGSGTIPGPPVSLRQQLDDVRSEPYRQASSAFAALTGKFRVAQWLAVAPGEAWFPGDGFTSRFRQLDPNDLAQARRILNAAQNRWILAAREGQIAVDAWAGNVDMKNALSAEVQSMGERDSRNGPFERLALTVLSSDISRRKDVILAIDAASRTDSQLSQEAKRNVFWLWTHAYYQAIAAHERSKLITFADSSEQGDRYRVISEQVKGPGAHWHRLWPKKWSEFLAAIGGKLGKSRAGENIQVDGRLIEEMKFIDPGSFRRLAVSARRDGVDAFNGKKGSMFDLVMAANFVMAKPRARREVLISLLVRSVTLGLLAALVVSLGLVTEFMTLNRELKGVFIVVAALLGAASSLPWGNIVEFFSLRKSAMYAVLNIYTGKQ